MTLTLPGRDQDPRRAASWGELNALLHAALLPEPEVEATRWRVRFCLPFPAPQVPVSECRVRAGSAHEAMGRDVVRQCMAVTGWGVTSVTKVRTI